jgi:hypothetical protein
MSSIWGPSGGRGESGLGASEGKSSCALKSVLAKIRFRAQSLGLYFVCVSLTCITDANIIIDNWLAVLCCIVFWVAEDEWHCSGRMNIIFYSDCE